MRQATGEGRTVPQRHLKRRGLFDGDGPEAWPTPVEKVSSLKFVATMENIVAQIIGVTVLSVYSSPQDNTFERVHGKRLSSAKFDTCAGDVGNYKCPITGNFARRFIKSCHMCW